MKEPLLTIGMVVKNEEKVEFRWGTAGGGNQARQRYVRKIHLEINPKVLINMGCT